MEDKAEKSTKDLSVIQKAHDLILWYLPLLNRLPRDQKFMLGDRRFPLGARSKYFFSQR